MTRRKAHRPLEQQPGEPDRGLNGGGTAWCQYRTTAGEYIYVPAVLG
jgi:hypothetical protein